MKNVDRDGNPGASRRSAATTTKQMITWLTRPLGDRHAPIVIVEAEKKSRRVQGWRHIEKLTRVLAVFEAQEEPTAERVAQDEEASHRSRKSNSDRDNPTQPVTGGNLTCR